MGTGNRRPASTRVQLAIRHEYALNSLNHDTSLFLFVKPGKEGLIPILYASSEKWHRRVAQGIPDRTGQSLASSSSSSQQGNHEDGQGHGLCSRKEPLKEPFKGTL